MKRKFVFLLLIALFAILLPTPNAFASTTVTPSAASVTVGDTFSVTVDGPVVLQQGGFTNTMRSSTGACTIRQFGSYTNGGQKTEYTCTGTDVLSVKTMTATTTGFKADGVYAFSLIVNPLPVQPPPPPAPAPHLSMVESNCTASYSAVVMNDGTATFTGSYVNTYCTPASLSVVQVAQGTVTYRTTCSRFRCYQGNGYVIKNIQLAVGESLVIRFS